MSAVAALGMISVSDLAVSHLTPRVQDEFDEEVSRNEASEELEI